MPARENTLPKSSCGPPPSPHQVHPYDGPPREEVIALRRQYVSPGVIRYYRGAKQMDAFLQAAIEEAEDGLKEGGIPIGSVLVHDGKILGRGHNRRIQGRAHDPCPQGSPILHGEMDALERAGRLPSAVYTHSVIYTTLSPCAMCSGAILLYRIPKVIIGENENFKGEEELLRDRGVIVEVQQDARCIAMMKRFILEHPLLWHEDIGV